MKKYMFLFLLLALLSGCAAAPQETPTPTETPATEVTLKPTPEPTPTPEPLTAEQAAEIYIHFLKNEIPCHEGDHSLYYSDFSRTEEIPITGFYIRDLTGDGLPELYAPDWKWPSIPVWSIQNGELTAIHSGSSYDTLLANGGIFTYVPGTAQSDVYAYCWLSPESREYPEISFEAYDMDSDGEMDSFYIDSAEVTRSEWEVRTAPYFALRDAEPTEEQKALPFLQWAAELGADIADFLDLEPWQAAYWDILMCPAAYKEFYVLENENTEVTKLYCFSLYDLDRDGIPELLLGDTIREYSDYPYTLLNILRWDEEAGTVKDMDGPRTYGLIDIVWFYENGYIGTANCAGDLYANYWKIEDDPDHYWYGYLRGGSRLFDADGTAVNGSEFFDMLGEEMDAPVWLELTPKNIRQAFFPAEGEEVTP